MSEKKKNQLPTITFQSKTENDLEFLFQVYYSTREDELAITGWNQKEIEEFLRMQFRLQHTQYMENYKLNGSFDIILVDGIPAGRLYVNRGTQDLRIIDIALLKEFRKKGIGSQIMADLIQEADHKNLSISLHVEINNPALKLYERLGFEKKEVFGIYHYMVRPAKLKQEV